MIVAVTVGVIVPIMVVLMVGMIAVLVIVMIMPVMGMIVRHGRGGMVVRAVIVTVVAVTRMPGRVRGSAWT